MALNSRLSVAGYHGPLAINIMNFKFEIFFQLKPIFCRPLAPNSLGLLRWAFGICTAPVGRIQEAGAEAGLVSTEYRIIINGSGQIIIFFLFHFTLFYSLCFIFLLPKREHDAKLRDWGIVANWPTCAIWKINKLVLKLFFRTLQTRGRGEKEAVVQIIS